MQGMANLTIIVLIGLSSTALAGPPFRRLTQKFFDFLSEHSTAYERELYFFLKEQHFIIKI